MTPQRGTWRGDAATEPLLRVRDLEVVYGGAIVALRGVSIEVHEGDVVALLGANGSGKTTLARAITGLLGVNRGRITAGVIEYEGESVVDFPPARLVRRGVSQVMEGRRVFPDLTVEENLRAGAFTRSKAEQIAALDRAMSAFPILAERRKLKAGYLSGGEQQMLAIARALMQSPKLLLLDEPSLGLAPLVVEQIRDIIIDINREGSTVVLIEQNAAMALSISHHGYVLERGEVRREGDAAVLASDRSIRDAYLGISDTARFSYRDLAESIRGARNR